MKTVAFFSVLFWISVNVGAQEKSQTSPNDAPNTSPLMRDEMKQVLESLKMRQPRLPFPTTPMVEASATNGRFRSFYLPESWTSGPRLAAPPASGGTPGAAIAGRIVDPAMTLDPTFKVRLFWIVSRVNNCHY